MPLNRKSLADLGVWNVKKEACRLEVLVPLEFQVSSHRLGSRPEKQVPVAGSQAVYSCITELCPQSGIIKNYVFSSGALPK